MNEENKNNGTVLWSVIVLIVLIASYGLFKYVKKDTVTEIPITTSPEVMPPYMYKDGTYSVVGQYVSPGGVEEVGIEVTVKNDLIVDAKSTPKSTRPVSIGFQGIFTDNFKVLVVGKKLGEVVLDKVSGSSLTPKGFNDAIVKIKTQAKS